MPKKKSGTLMSNSSLESEGQVADFAVRFSAASEAGLVPRLASENSLFYRVHALGASSTGFGSHFLYFAKHATKRRK